MSPTKTPAAVLPATLDITIEELTPTGEGLAAWDGQPVTVRFVLPGEVVRVRPFWSKGRRGDPPYVRGDLLDVLRPSPDRVPAPCWYFGSCGGCQFQHATYERQLAIKRDHLCGALAEHEIPGVPDPRLVIGSPAPYGYRNQLRMTLDREGRLCFTLAGRRRTFPVVECLIAAPPINAVLAAECGGYPARHQVAIRAGLQTGDLSLIPPRVPAPEGAGGALTEKILGYPFEIQPSSFFQVNTGTALRHLPPQLADLGWPAEGEYSQADILALLVLAGLELTGTERVIDAYAGVGVFARMLADRCGEVVAIEESATAIADARVNLRDLTNVSIVQDKTEAGLPAALPADAVVLDPARPGCAPPVLDALLAQPVSRLVYVSCEPATLARDLARLAAFYHIDWIQPLDMFPQTRHLETVVCLSRRPTGETVPPG